MSSGPGFPAELLVATRNRGKAAELTDLAAALGMRVVTLDDVGLPRGESEDDLERHPTFEANALAKAHFYFAAGGGRSTVSDDSGLEVDALDGAPGVYSRRWTGAVGTEAEVTASNNDALRRRLHGATTRAARFTCAVAYVDVRRAVVCRGVVHGRIAHAPRGTRGFGYDSLFEAAELGWRTFGEVSVEEKGRVSHRSRAFAALASALRSATAR